MEQSLDIVQQMYQKLTELDVKKDIKVIKKLHLNVAVMRIGGFRDRRKRLLFLS